MDTREQLSRTSVRLHWIVALVVIGLCGTGLIMTNTDHWWLYPWHKSTGVAITLVVVWRAAHRLRQGFPPPLDAGDARMQQLALRMHQSLLACTVLMPLSGMLFSGASGHGFGLFGLTLVPTNHDPAHPENVLPYHAGLADLGQAVHHYLGYLLVLLVLLHIGAALKHQLIDKDGVLARMQGKRVG